MNNTAFNLTQALQTASWDAKQWQTFFFVQDDFRVTPDLTLNIGLRYELSTVPLGMFGATDPESLRGRWCPAPPSKDTNNWAPRIGFTWSPRSSNSLLGDGKTVFRGGFGMGYDVLFYNLLTVNGSNYPRIATASINNVLDTYPNLLPAGGSAVFSPLNAYTNSPADTVNPDSKFWSFSIGARARRLHRGDRLHRQPERPRHQPDPREPVGAHARAGGAGGGDAEPERDPERAGAPRLPAVRRPHADPRLRRARPATTSRRARRTTASTSSVSKRFSHGLQFGDLVHAQQVREQQRRVARRDRDGRLEPASAELLRLRRGLERLAVRRAEPLRGQLPVGDPGPEVGRPPAHPGRLAVLGHHGVPVRAAVHDRHRRRLERRRHDRAPTARTSAAAALIVGRRAPGLHEQRLRCRLRSGPTTCRWPTRSATAALGRNSERAASLLEHRPQPAEAHLALRRQASWCCARTRSTSSTRTTTGSRTPT